MADPLNVIASIPRLAFDGLEAPCSIAPFDWEHRLAGRSFPYVDGEAHDDVGMGAVRSAFVLHFHNSIEVGLYPKRWRAWEKRLKSGKIGKLTHPVSGTYDARVERVSGAAEATSRGGIDVTVSFVSSLKDPTKPTKFTIVDADVKAAATQAEADGAAFGIYWPDGKGETTLSGAIGAVQGAIESADMTISGALNQVTGTIDGMIESVEYLNDHASIAVYDNLLTGWAALTEAAENVAATSRATATKTVPADTTLDAIAAETGNTTSEIQGLNLSLLRSPTVPKGTVVTYYSE